MPTTPLRNLLYRAALPLLAPSPRGQMSHVCTGHSLHDLPGYEAILKRHHVLGSTLLIGQDDTFARVDTSVRKPAHHAQANTLYRVASITKMATALVTLMLAEDGCFSLDTPIVQLLPGDAEPELSGVTVRQLLSHTSGLRDTPAVDQALASGGTWREVFHAGEVRASAPGAQFRYCNFGFGLLGCALEQVSGKTVDSLFTERLFTPLGMEAALDASRLEEARMMPISRVLPYHEGHDMVITPLGRTPLIAPDPKRHFGHTAGAMYTDAVSLSKLLHLIASGGCTESGQHLLKESTVAEMTRQHASYGAASPGMSYGLGLVLLRDKALSDHLLLGHQGYAYGCADGAFFEADTGRMMIFLNGGCSEARTRRLGLCNRDLLRWTFRKELPSWT